MAKYWKKKVVLFKNETTYATDPVPVAATNAIQSEDFSIDALNVTTVQRNLDRPYMGNQDQIPVMSDVKLSFKVAIAGGGAAGTAPKWGPLLRASGFSETISAGVSVAYAPASSGLEAGTLYFYMDGVLHKVTGARLTVKFEFESGKVPYMTFNGTGLFNGPTDAALVSPVFTGWSTPRPSNPAWTGAVSLAGDTPKLNKWSLDMANAIDHALWMNAEAIEMTDRAPKGSLEIECPPLATHDYFADCNAGTKVAFSLAHGVSAGNIVTLATPKLQLMNPKYGQKGGVTTLQMESMAHPNAGNDELTVTCT